MVTIKDGPEHGMPENEARTCGGCNLCCKVYEIPELDKVQDEWCGNCQVGVGCGIYATRPPVCSGYRCLWLDDASMPDEMRPDRSHIVLRQIDFESGDRICQGMIDHEFPKAADAPMAIEVFQRIRERGYAVRILCNRHKLVWDEVQHG